MSGDVAAARRIVRVQAAPFEVGAELAALTAGRTDAGAVASFVGLVRDGGADGPDGGLESMTLEHYPGMTERALEAIAEKAAARWPLTGALILHRVGTLAPADPIVLAAAASAHRHAAFEAAAFLMDYLKTDAPFWKREVAKGGAARWVDARESDRAAAARWETPPRA